MISNRDARALAQSDSQREKTCWGPRAGGGGVRVAQGQLQVRKMTKSGHERR